MRLNAPTVLFFYASVALAALGVIGSFVAIPVVSVYAFWFVVAGYVVLALGNVMKGM